MEYTLGLAVFAGLMFLIAFAVQYSLKNKK